MITILERCLCSRSELRFILLCATEATEINTVWQFGHFWSIKWIYKEFSIPRQSFLACRDFIFGIWPKCSLMTSVFLKPWLQPCSTNPPPSSFFYKRIKCSLTEVSIFFSVSWGPWLYPDCYNEQPQVPFCPCDFRFPLPPVSASVSLQSVSLIASAG